MSFGNILGQLLQDGLGGQTQTRDRLRQTGQNLGAGGGPGGILAQLQGALGGNQGGFADKARDFLTKDQVGGLSGAQVGGIGAVAGALLGGGLGGAARGGAMAVLGTLAVSALQRARANGAGGEPAEIAPQEIAALTGPEAERLLVRAMISAAKADGQVDQAELEKVIGKFSDDGVTADEKAFVMQEIRAPLDIQTLALDARTPEQAAEVYAASLLAIDIDSDPERQYLRDLAQALRLDADTVAELHRMTGAPV